jgi:hypothetical protein
MSTSFCQRVWIANKTQYIRDIKRIDCWKYLLNCEDKIGCQTLKTKSHPQSPRFSERNKNHDESASELKKIAINIPHLRFLRILRQCSFYAYYYNIVHIREYHPVVAILRKSYSYHVQKCDEAGLPVDFVSRDLGYSTQPLTRWCEIRFLFLCTVP